MGGAGQRLRERERERERELPGRTGGRNVFEVNWACDVPHFSGRARGRKRKEQCPKVQRS